MVRVLFLILQAVPLLKKLLDRLFFSYKQFEEKENFDNIKKKLKDSAKSKNTEELSKQFNKDLKKDE